MAEQKYVMREMINGVRLADTEVNEEYVKNFTSPAAREFFENLGGSETLRRTKDGIHVRSVSPDKSRIRSVLFTPID